MSIPEFILYLLFFRISISISTPSCPKYKYGKKQHNKICLYMNSSDHQAIYFSIESCKKTEICPFVRNNDIEPFKNVTCIPISDSFHTKIPIGESCSKKSECASFKCSREKKCIPNPKKACNSTAECEFNTFCDKSMNVTKCSPVRKINESCVFDEDCVFGSSCFNSKCTKYFTLNDGEITNHKILCRGGYSFFYNGNEICASLNETDNTNSCLINSLNKLPSISSGFYCESNGNTGCGIPSKQYVMNVARMLDDEFKRVQGNTSQIRRLPINKTAANAYLSLLTYPMNVNDSNFSDSAFIEYYRLSDPFQRTLSGSRIAISLISISIFLFLF